MIGSGAPWTITPGGRFSKDTPGVRQLATALAEAGNAVVIWDRPNTGASSMCFDGPSESAMQADALAGLLRQLDMGPAVVTGGSGGSRVSLLTAVRHPDVARAVSAWWISGGIYGLLSLAVHYCGDSIAAAWRSGMGAVAELAEWAEPLAANPGNRDRLLSQDRAAFIATLEQWMLAYVPRADALVPGILDSELEALDVPALVFRSGVSDPHHTRQTSEQLARLLPNATLVEPPWDDAEWNERTAAADEGLFVRWPLLAPQLLDWAARL